MPDSPQTPTSPVSGDLPPDWSGDELPRDGRLLGIDFGTHRLGFAISTPEQSMSCPLETWVRRTHNVDARRLRELDDDYRIVGYVVGLPLHMNGDEGDSAHKARQFGRWLRRELGRPVAFWDERCSSAAADTWMQEAELTRDRRKGLRDRLAAHVILQSYLESRQHQLRTGTGSRMDPFLAAAIDEARTGLAEGGIPIGSVLVIDGTIVGRGHNRRVQQGSAILHAEMDCIENAGRLSPADYSRSTLYSTLSPCDMCSGTALLYKIPRIVIGENLTFRGPEDYVRSRGVELKIANDEECAELMRQFIAEHPALWNEDIGEP